MHRQLKIRLIAAGLHSIFTLLVASALYFLIFYVWYPTPFDHLLGGFELLYWIVGIDLILGPLLMFIIFNPIKSRKMLITDICAIISLQLIAMIYGMHILFAARPVYIAFVKDRFEVNIAAEINQEDLDSAINTNYHTLSWSGPQVVTIRNNLTENELLEATEKVILAGKSYSQYPKFFQPYDKTAKEIVVPEILSLDLLSAKNKEQQPQINDALSTLKHKYPDKAIGWTVMLYRDSFGTVLLDKNTAEILAYLPVEPSADKLPTPEANSNSTP